MGSYMKLPLINFSNLKQQSPNWESVKMEVKEALEEYSCFEATFDDIPPHLHKSVFEGIQQVFDLPLEAKLRTMSDTHFAGYVGQLTMNPLYESLGIEDVLNPAKIDATTDLLWPEHNPKFSKSLHSYSKQLHELDVMIRTMILEILGLEKYFDEHMDSSYYFVRIQKYNVPPSKETELGLVPHTDKNLVTILYQNEVRGLQVEVKDGQWITPEPSKNSFLVLIGEAFHAWTNGRLNATNHRVIISGDKARHSIGLFTFPKPGYIIKAPEDMVDEDHPVLFKPYENCEFSEFLFANEKRGVVVSLKDFCGAN